MPFPSTIVSFQIAKQTNISTRAEFGNGLQDFLSLAIQTDRSQISRIMSKRGVSAAEKRANLQSYFHQHKTFFLQKELEKGCAKELKMKPEVVIEVLEQLVDDGLVRKEKIGRASVSRSIPPKHVMVLTVIRGIQNLFWSVE